MNLFWTLGNTTVLFYLNSGVPFLDIYFLVSTGTATTRLTEGLFGKTLTIPIKQ